MKNLQRDLGLITLETDQYQFNLVRSKLNFN